MNISFRKFIALLLVLFLAAETVDTAAFAVNSSGAEPWTKWGSVEESWNAGNDRPQVYFIQDAHDSIEAQKNIAAIIQEGVRHQAIQKVFEEGYAGEVPVDHYFEKVESLKKHRAADYYLDQLWVGGAEYARILAKQKFDLIGAEDEKLYLQNLKQYQIATQYQKLVADELRSLRLPIETWTSRNWTRDQKQFYLLWSRHASGKIDFLNKAFGLSDLIRKKKITASPSMLFFQGLRQGKGVDDLTIQNVMREAESLENQAEELFFKDSAREALTHLKQLELIERLNHFEVGTDDFEQVLRLLDAEPTRRMVAWIAEKNKKPILLSSAWETMISAAVDFYRTARQRDEAVINRLSQVKSHEKVMLVFGGFHKAHLIELMKKSRLSYSVITPRISGLSPKHQEMYREKMHAPVAVSTFARAARNGSAFLFARRQIPFNDPPGLFWPRQTSPVRTAMMLSSVSRSEARSKGSLTHSRGRKKVEYKAELPVMVMRSVFDHSLMDPLASLIGTTTLIIDLIRSRSHKKDKGPIHRMAQFWLFKNQDLIFKRDDYRAEIKRYLEIDDAAHSRKRLTRLIQGAQRLINEHIAFFKAIEEAKKLLGKFYRQHGADSSLARQPLAKLLDAADEARVILKTQKRFLKGEIKREKVSIRKLIKEVQAAVVRNPKFSMVSENIKIKAASMLEFSVDARLIKRILGEMFKNSFYAYKKNHPIVDHDLVQSMEGFKFEVIAEIDAGTGDLEIRVKDNSGGISALGMNDGIIPGRKSIFDLNYSTTGGGIGLSEAWHVIHDHAGSIDVRIVEDSKKNEKGTLFVIRIPSQKTRVSTSRSETRINSKRVALFVTATGVGLTTALLTDRFEGQWWPYLFGIYAVGDLTVNTVAFRLSSLVRGEPENHIKLPEAFHTAFLYFLAFLPAFFYQPFIANGVDSFNPNAWLGSALKVGIDLLVTVPLYYFYLFLENWRVDGEPWRKAFYTRKEFSEQLLKALGVFAAADLIAYTSGYFLGVRIIPIVTSISDLIVTMLIASIGSSELIKKDLLPGQPDATETPEQRSETRAEPLAEPVVIRGYEGLLDRIEARIAEVIGGRVRGFMLGIEGPSAIGKGFTSKIVMGLLAMFGLDVHVLELDSFLNLDNEKVRKTQARLVDGGEHLTEWDFWDEDRAFAFLKIIKNFLVSGQLAHNQLPNVKTEILEGTAENPFIVKWTIQNAWHRDKNDQGSNRYPETITLRRNSVVIVDGKYNSRYEKKYRESQGEDARLLDMNVSLSDTWEAIRDKYLWRTQEKYAAEIAADPQILLTKQSIYDHALAPSYQRYHEEYARYPDIVLNVQGIWRPRLSQKGLAPQSFVAGDAIQLPFSDLASADSRAQKRKAWAAHLKNLARFYIGAYPGRYRVLKDQYEITNVAKETQRSFRPNAKQILTSLMAGLLRIPVDESLEGKFWSVVRTGAHSARLRAALSVYLTGQVESNHALLKKTLKQRQNGKRDRRTIYMLSLAPELFDAALDFGVSRSGEKGGATYGEYESYLLSKWSDFDKALEADFFSKTGLKIEKRGQFMEFVKNEANFSGADKKQLIQNTLNVLLGNFSPAPYQDSVETSPLLSIRRPGLREDIATSRLFDSDDSDDPDLANSDDLMLSMISEDEDGDRDIEEAHWYARSEIRERLDIQYAAIVSSAMQKVRESDAAVEVLVHAKDFRQLTDDEFLEIRRVLAWKPQVKLIVRGAESLKGTAVTRLRLLREEFSAHSQVAENGGNDSKTIRVQLTKDSHWVPAAGIHTFIYEAELQGILPTALLYSLANAPQRKLIRLSQMEGFWLLFGQKFRLLSQFASAA